MANEFYTVLTETGLAKIAAAQAAGSNLTLAKMHVGTGGGSNYYTVYTQTRLMGLTALIDEKWQGALNDSYIDKDNPNWVVLEGVVPTNIGGWMIREIGITDTDGDLIAVGRFPETFKPLLTDGAAQELVLRSIMEISNTANVNLSIDPSVVLATRQWVDQNKVDKNQIGASGSQIPTVNGIFKNLKNPDSNGAIRNIFAPRSIVQVSSDTAIVIPICRIDSGYTGMATGVISGANRDGHTQSDKRAAGYLKFFFRKTNRDADPIQFSLEETRTLQKFELIEYTNGDKTYAALRQQTIKGGGGRGWESSTISLDAVFDMRTPGGNQYDDINIMSILGQSYSDAAEFDNDQVITPQKMIFTGRPGDQIGNNTAWHSGNTLVDSNGFIKQA